MTFDERVDRLTERHEALAQSLELLTQDVRAIGGKIDQLSGIVSSIAEGTLRLMNVADGHEGG